MRLFRHLQHWLTGHGTRLQVADFVPLLHPIRQWADTFPWAALVAAIERSVAQRFPKDSPRGRPPVSPRVLLALEVLKHEVGASDEALCARLRTDFAVMYACGIEAVQWDCPQEHFGLPATLAQFRQRIAAALLDELLAIQTAAAMEEGLVSPAHRLGDTCPVAQGSQRVTDATTLDKAQKTSSTSSRTSRRKGAGKRARYRARHTPYATLCSRSCAALAGSVGARATSSLAWYAKPQSSC